MNRNKPAITPRLVIQYFIFIVVIPFLPLLISRQWDWWEAWVYAIIGVLSFIISRVLAGRRHPDVIKERAKILQHEDTQAWDKQLAPLAGLSGALVLVVAGLDALFDWSHPFSLPIKIISLIAILLGYALSDYALIENRYFSVVVRLQSERGHEVVSSGPYRWMRHPGYAGALLFYWATPFFLDSIWAFLPTMLMSIILIIRTRLEDRFLQDELLGYREYTGKVRYRLLPGVW